MKIMLAEKAADMIKADWGRSFKLFQGKNSYY